MHFEVLVEDQSGKAMLEVLIPKIIGDQDTFRVIGYRGIGRIPRNLTRSANVANRLLLNNLPRVLRGYGKTFVDDPDNAVVVVCDLDDKCLKNFREELFAVLNACNPKPETRFCIAIEEGEAWLLGDIRAVKAAYPRAKASILNRYKNDAICGTWELLADAVYRGGSNRLTNEGGQAVGREKSNWSKTIAPHMDVENNASPSFRYFREKVRGLAGAVV